MPANTRVFRFDAGEPRPSKSSPASLGYWIRDVPGDLNGDEGNLTCAAISEARHLLCLGTSEDRVYLHDFAAGRWVGQVGSGTLAEDAQHTEFFLEEVCCTRDYLLVSVGGEYYVHAFSDLRPGEELWAEENIPLTRVVPAEDAGEGYQNLLFVPAPDGAPGVNLISIRPHAVRRTYRLPPELSQPPPSLAWFVFNRASVLASFSTEDLPFQILWNLQTGEYRNRGNFRVSENRRERGRPRLEERYLHFEKTLVEVPSFRTVHTFGTRHSTSENINILGIAGDNVVTVSNFEPGREETFTIYQLPGFVKVAEVTIEGYRWEYDMQSQKFFLLEKRTGRRDFILVDLADFCEMILKG